MKTKKTEQCFCPSYYDDDNVLRDCTCGKCDNKTTKWEEFNNLMDRYIRYAGDWHLSGCSFVFYDQGVCNCKTSQNKKVIKSFIQELMDSQRAEIVDNLPKEIDEGGGWDLAFKDYKSCCPGDDCAYGYNQAISEVRGTLDQKEKE